MITIREIRLNRWEAALIELQQELPAGARVLRVRYTKFQLVCLYRV